MGKASSSKKVARAASTGGGRTSRGKMPVLWYGSLVVILLAGLGLTAFSREQRLDALNSPSSKEEPRANDSHWHTALGIRVCDRWLDPIQDQNDPKGIHSHGDGIIHVHPFVASAAGKQATFERYAEAVKGEIEGDRFAWPGPNGKKQEHRNGDKCGDEEAEVKAFYDGKLHVGDPSSIRLTDRGKLVLALVPKDTTYEQIGDPPSTPNLDNLSDMPQPPAPPAQPVDPAATVDPAAPPASAAPDGPPASTPASTASPPASTATPPTSTPPSSVAG